MSENEKMIGVLELTINPQDAVPEKGRADFLQKHGVFPAESKIRCTASLEMWEKAPDVKVKPDGTIAGIHQEYSAPCLYGRNVKWLDDAIISQIHRTGIIPENFDATVSIENALADKKREKDKEEQNDKDRALYELKHFCESSSYGDAINSAYLKLLTTEQQTEYHRVLSERALALEKCKEREDQEKREQKERIENSRKDFVQFALDGHIDETTQRAAREGYDIISAVLKFVTGQFSSKPDHIEYETTENKYEKRASPSTAAFDLYDLLCDEIKNMKKPESLALKVSQIKRIKVEEEDDERSEWKTSVIVEMRSPCIKPRCLIWFTE